MEIVERKNKELKKNKEDRIWKIRKDIKRRKNVTKERKYARILCNNWINVV